MALAICAVLLVTMSGMASATDIIPESDQGVIDTQVISEHSEKIGDITQEGMGISPYCEKITTSDWDSEILKTRFKPCDRIRFNLYFTIYDDSYVTALHPLVFSDDGSRLLYHYKWPAAYCKAGKWLFYLKTSIPCDASPQDLSWAALIATKDGQCCKCNGEFSIV